MVFYKKILLKFLLKQIENANDYEINEIMRAVRQRYKTAYPEWNVIYMALPKKEKEERRQILDGIAALLE